MLDILYEDNHLLVLNKPAGLSTQPSEHHQNSLETEAKLWIKETTHKPGNVYLHAIHRLDRPVSGIVVFARTSKALSRLNESLRQKKAHKTYLALVEGSPSPSGVLEHHLIHDSHRARIVTQDHSEAKIARLSYRVIEKKLHALVEITLDTGRYHQIRVQFSAIGCPILGDHKYGSKHPWQAQGIALHHHKLTLPHPITKEELTFEAPMPPSFTKAT